MLHHYIMGCTLINYVSKQRNLVQWVLIYVVKMQTKGYLVGQNWQQHTNVIKLWPLSVKKKNRVQRHWTEKRNDGKISNGSNIPKSCLQASAVQSRGLLILYGTNDPSRHGPLFFLLGCLHCLPSSNSSGGMLTVQGTCWSFAIGIPKPFSSHGWRLQWQ